MASAEAIERAYRQRTARLLTAMTERLASLYGSKVGTDDIDRTFAAFAPQAAQVVKAAQAAGVTLTLGYLRGLLSAMVGRPVEPAKLAESPVGTTAAGASLVAGMAAIPSLMKAAIGRGVSPEAALDIGRSYVLRFADAETTAAIDDASDQVNRATPEVTGWEGIVSSDACEGCQGNAGTHSFDEEMYRHGGCNCIRQLVTAEAA